MDITVVMRPDILAMDTMHPRTIGPGIILIAALNQGTGNIITVARTPCRGMERLPITVPGEIAAFPRR